MAADKIPNTSLPRLLRRRDVAELVGLSERTVERLDLEGDGPACVRLGRRSVRYHPEAVARWIQERTRGAKPEPRPAD